MFIHLQSPIPDPSRIHGSLWEIHLQAEVEALSWPCEAWLSLNFTNSSKVERTYVKNLSFVEKESNYPTIGRIFFSSVWRIHGSSCLCGKDALNCISTPSPARRTQNAQIRNHKANMKQPWSGQKLRSIAPSCTYQMENILISPNRNKGCLQYVQNMNITALPIPQDIFRPPKFPHLSFATGGTWPP